ncbi:hypothetical protein NXS19_008787 [Fusarium pseudograminearum]|nr:hypothetical protein NXS19_008787 [Fusarium pseudograminearum]
MQFVANHTPIPVPKVHYAFIHKGTSYIVMQHIKGQTAANGWTSRSDESKERILEQLRGMITELRSVTPPKLYWGPYASVREFHEALVNNIPWDADYTKYPDLIELFDFYRQAENKLVLTHGDLSSLNILVRGDRVVGIIDWETAGWFPKYWEYTTAKCVNPNNLFWADVVDQFVTPMPDEWKMDFIRRRYFGDLP